MIVSEHESRRDMSRVKITLFMFCFSCCDAIDTEYESAQGLRGGYVVFLGYKYPFKSPLVLFSFLSFFFTQPPVNYNLQSVTSSPAPALVLASPCLDQSSPSPLSR